MSRKKKEEVKEATKNQEEKADFVKDEMQTAFVNATNTVTANASTLQRTITVPSNAITIQSFVSETFQGSGTLVASGTVIAGRKDNLYHYAICSIDLGTIANQLGISLDVLKNSTLKIYELQYEGTDVCAFITESKTLFTWEDGTEIAFGVNEAYNSDSNEVKFLVVPRAPQSNGYITFTPADMSLQYNFTIVSNKDIQYVTNDIEEEHRMDIYFRNDLAEGARLPVLITIHGGSWSGGDKGGYNYMTDFITDTCNCVHVNMNYRLTTGASVEGGVTYKDMLDDIQSVISYLQSHADIYHVDASKIALMGHSAGGHLALLYAYKAAQCAICPYNDNCGSGNQANENCPYDKYKVSPAIPIELVISEAGPTNFVQWDAQGNLIVPDNNTCAMAGVMNNDSETDKAEKLEAASPINYIDANAPYTILVYGNGVEFFDIPGVTPLYDGTQGDGLIPYAHATAVYNELGSGKCSLFQLREVNHNQFGEGTDKWVYPNVAIKENDDTEVRALKTIIQNYYNTILNTLQSLAAQED